MKAPRKAPQRSRIETALAGLKSGDEKALALFLTAGDPSLKATGDMVAAAVDGGADIIELGIPFSDPLADGPVIQRSFQRAISAGANVPAALKIVESVRKRVDTPIVFMVASTLVINFGVSRFMRMSAEAGADGVIVPDAPPEEAEEFSPPARASGLDTIYLAAPTTTTARLRRISSLCSGFLYYINVTGVTGAELPSMKELGKSVARVRKATKLPILAGFGVKTPEQAGAISRVTDGVIIGSRAVEIVNGSKNRAEAARNLLRFTRSVKRAMGRRS